MGVDDVLVVVVEEEMVVEVDVDVEMVVGGEEEVDPKELELAMLDIDEEDIFKEQEVPSRF